MGDAMTDAEADWMIERRRRARDTVVERVEHLREVKEIPPELMEKMSAIEAAYAAWKADRGRLDSLEARADQTDSRLSQMAAMVAELARAAGAVPSESGGTALAIRVENQHAAPAPIEADLTQAVQALQLALQGMNAVIGEQVRRVDSQVEVMDNVFGEMRAAARRLG
jgi:hypothetical protein